MLKFKNANLVFVGLNIKNYTYATIELISREGRLEYKDRGALITIQRSKKDKIFGEDYMPEKKYVRIQDDINNYQLNVLNQLHYSLEGKKSYLCKGSEALETLRVINKII